MDKKNLFYKALVSFIFFIVIAVRALLVGYLKLIPIRSPLNRGISWFLILPILLIGSVLSFTVVEYYISQWIKTHKLLVDRNLLLALPCLLFALYLVVMLIIGGINYNY